MSSSSFLYNWDNISHFIKKIYDIINFDESTCDLYTMDYIPQSPTHCSKGNIECVLKCTKFPGKQANGYMFKKTSNQLNTNIRNLVNSFGKSNFLVLLGDQCLEFESLMNR